MKLGYDDPDDFVNFDDTDLVKLHKALLASKVVQAHVDEIVLAVRRRKERAEQLRANFPIPYEDNGFLVYDF